MKSTEEQLAVILAPASARIVVRAKPGTGKTHCLVERAVHLAGEFDREKSVLALSFTRSVVGEIIERTHADVGEALRASTIHSFAARVLLESGMELSGGFKRTVSEATELVHEGAIDGRFDHVLVDEIQDLHGEIQEFVIALLRSCSGGFSVFGDPDQAIYGFEDRKKRLDDPFVAIERFPDVETLELVTNHRVSHGTAIKSLSEGESVTELVRELNGIDGFDQLAMLVRRSRGDIAVLTRTNGQALFIAQELYRRGADAQIRQSRDSTTVPGWVAEIASKMPAGQWKRGPFEEAVETLTDPPPSERAWAYVRSLARATQMKLSTSSIRQAVGLGITAEVVSDPPARAVISTVHRAKGLEWDNVVIALGDSRHDSPEEDRIKYVALTRSKLQTFKFELKIPNGFLKGTKPDRWRLETWGGGWRNLELKIGDVESTLPDVSDEAEKAQRYIRAEVDPGDGVEVVRANGESHFQVLHEGTSIGSLAGSFHEGLADSRLSKINSLIGARVLTLRSASGPPELTDAAGLSNSGLWVVPEIYGFAEIGLVGE